MSHSRVSPSSAHRWVHCPGSVAMTAQFPDPSGAAAAEGEATHWVGSTMLEGGPRALPGDTAPNGVLITTEMIDAAMVYVMAVRSVAGLTIPLAVEQKIAIPAVHAECFGTIDCYCWESATELHVWDLKYGFGIVEPYENWQLICYVLGVIDGINGVDDQKLNVNIHIVQPRPFHFDGPVRTWRLTACGLRGHRNRLNYAAAQALEPSAPVTSGPQCKYCSARHACPAAQKTAMYAVDCIDNSRAELLTPEQAATELAVLRRIVDAAQFRLTGIEGQVKAFISAGQTVPGWSLQNGAGRQQWSVAVEEVIALSDLMGINLRKSVDTITPAQAKKAGLPDDIVAAYTMRAIGEAKLVPTTNTLASRVFTQEG